MRTLVSALVLLFLLPSAAWAAGCTDVRSLDMRNATIALDGPALTKGPGSSLPAERDLVHLHDGVAFLSDDPGAPHQRDWRVSLLADRLVRPDPSTRLRLVVVEKNHRTGTGAWIYVMAFGCERGHAVRLFWHRGEGLRLTLEKGPRLELTEAVWARRDPHCCPSHERRLIYRWSPARHRYRLLRHAAAR